MFTRPTKILRPPLAVPPRPGPAPRSPSHLPGLWVTRHQRGFTHVRPSGLPLACAPGWNGTRFGFFPELRTPQLPATHVRAGTGPEHWPGATPPTSSALQSAHSLATCNLVSHVFRPVDPAECVQLNPPRPYPAAVRAGQGRAGHARSLMEGLKGTAIRLAVRDPGCPQAPVLARARWLPALMRGSSCGWLRPRPPIPARTTRSQHPARRVARQPGKGAAGTGTRIFDERSCPGDVNGSPGADRTSPAPPALVKASCAQIAIAIGRQADPAASNEGSSLGNKQRCSAMCPLGQQGRDEDDAAGHREVHGPPTACQT